MIKKLRKKFVIYSILSIFALLTIILGTVNIVNFTLVGSDADRITLVLSENGGKFNEGPGQNGGKPNNMGPESPEMQMSIRYFTVKYDETMTKTMVSYKINSYSESDCLIWADELVNSSIGWTRTNYRYRVYKINTDTYVSVIDQGRELLPSFRVLNISLIGSAVGLLVTGLIIVLISKIIFKPVEESDRKQKRFILEASRSLKTPVTVIGVNNDLLVMKNGVTDENKLINKEVNKLTKVVNDLNELADLDAKKDKLEGKEFNISNLLLFSIDSFKEQIEKKNIDLKTEIEKDLNFTGDEEEIKKLFNVLLENSVKYCTNSIKIIMNRRENGILLIMQNPANYELEDGPLDLYLERFERGNTDQEGNGIGLSVARGVTKLHKGRIYVSSENNVFTVKVEI